MKIHELMNTIQKGISPNDEMFAGNESHYFSVGLSALECIEVALLSAKRNQEDIKMILDMPCGYGRVLRALKAAFPGAKIVACDLNRNGVDYCTKNFGAKALYSFKNPSMLPKEKYDLIWCGSLLTHLDFPRWDDFISFFQTSLNSGGILVFTAHGRFVEENIRSGNNTYGLEQAVLKNLLDAYTHVGYSYVNYPHADDYGISMSTASHIISQVEKYSDLRLLHYKEQGWDNHQDVIACSKR